jgi:hypothetical protein
MVSLLVGELVVAHQARDIAEVELPGLVDKAAAVDWRREGAEE